MNCSCSDKCIYPNCQKNYYRTDDGKINKTLAAVINEDPTLRLFVYHPFQATKPELFDHRLNLAVSGIKLGLAKWLAENY